MNCPYCGKEMESAYIQSFQQIYLNRGRKPRFNAAGDLSSRSLSRFSLTKAPFVKASYCEDCGKIIVDLKDKAIKLDLGGGDPTELPMAFDDGADSGVKAEAVSALTMLGFAAAASGKAVDKILKNDPAMKVEAVIREALKML